MYKYDLHIHTSQVSDCGWVEAEKIPHLYKKKGYRGIVITDHYKAKTFDCFGDEDWDRKMDLFMYGFNRASEVGQKIDLNVMFALEMTFDGSVSDFLVYGITEEFLRKKPKLFRYTLEEFKEISKNEDLLIFQAHPFQVHHLRMGMTAEDPVILDGVEVFNGNIRHNARNDKAYEFAAKNNLKMVAGSDFHRAGDEGRGGIITGVDIKNISQLVEVLKIGNYKIMFN